ncbi:MAG TPA: hypothetical protein VMR54_17910 [Thermoanaerobaculia bacterium]|nr:hypothetical protein [Thermoanaerobaculia bacterium]
MNQHHQLPGARVLRDVVVWMASKADISDIHGFETGCLQLLGE